MQEETLPPELQALASKVRHLAQEYAGDNLALLALLRLLQSLHKEVREGPFQDSLPGTRQALLALLKDIEAQGGWPYIYRLNLHSLMGQLEEEPGVISGSPTNLGD